MNCHGILQIVVCNSLGLETSLIDEAEPDLEWSRQPVVNTYCNEDQAENWEDLFDQFDSDEFVEESDCEYRIFHSLLQSKLYSEQLQSSSDEILFTAKTRVSRTAIAS